MLYRFSTSGSELIIGSLAGLDVLFILTTVIRYKGSLTAQATASVEPESSLSEVPLQPS